MAILIKLAIKTVFSVVFRQALPFSPSRLTTLVHVSELCDLVCGKMDNFCDS